MKYIAVAITLTNEGFSSLWVKRVLNTVLKCYPMLPILAKKSQILQLFIVIESHGILFLNICGKSREKS